MSEGCGQGGAQSEMGHWSWDTGLAYTVYETLHLGRQERGAQTWCPDGLEAKPGSAAYQLYDLSSPCLGFLICKVRIIIVILHGFIARIDWMTLRKALALSNML